MLDRSISRRYRWKVQGRLAVLEYAAAHGIRPAAARFGLDRKTVRAWRRRLREAGDAGLVPRLPQAPAPQNPRPGGRAHCPRTRRVRLGRVSDAFVAVAGASGEGRARNDLEDLR